MQENYEFIEKAIVEFIKSYGVRIILSKIKMGGVIRVYCYNWVGSDGRYYSLLAPCSMSCVYPCEGFTVTGGRDIHGVLQHNLAVFKSKDEWDAGHWTREYVENYSKNLGNDLLHRSSYQKCVGGYRVVGVQLHVQPCIGVSIWYKKNVLGCFTIWYGSKTSLNSTDPGFKEFVDSLGFSGCLEVTLMVRDIKSIGVFGDDT